MQLKINIDIRTEPLTWGRNLWYESRTRVSGYKYWQDDRDLDKVSDPLPGKKQNPIYPAKNLDKRTESLTWWHKVGHGNQKTLQEDKTLSRGQKPSFEDSNLDSTTKTLRLGQEPWHEGRSLDMRTAIGTWELDMTWGHGPWHEDMDHGMRSWTMTWGQKPGQEDKNLDQTLLSRFEIYNPRNVLAPA
jgi:hypothetical protein